MDNTKAQGILLDWSLLDDTGGIPFLATPELNSGENLDSAIHTFLHIDIAHIDANAVTAGSEAKIIVWIKSGTTNEDWHVHHILEATGNTANVQILAAASGSGQGNPERIEVAATANFQIPGDIYFLWDAGTIANSCIVCNKTYAINDYVTHINDLVNAYDNADYLVNIIDSFPPLLLPDSIQASKITFHNPDGDANYACRVHYTQVTDFE